MEVIDAGVDWITLTVAGEKKGKRAVALARRIINEEMHAGNELRNWGGMGYHGYKCGGIQVGEREDSIIIRATGGLAHKWHRELIPLADNVSRLDLQVTIHEDTAPALCIAKKFRKAKRFLAGSARSPKIALYQVAGGSSTIYIGSRQSDVFIRVYDKGEESGEPDYDGCVRYEVEFKGDAALCIAKRLITHSRPILFAHATVFEYLVNRGILIAPSDEKQGEAYRPRVRGDHRKTLRWLNKSVAPSLISLIHRHLITEALDALGLTAYVQPITQQPSRVERDVNGRKSHGGKVESLPTSSVVHYTDNEPLTFQERRRSGQRGGGS